MATEIRQYVENCNTCASLQAKQSMQPLSFHDVPERPWQKVAMDIFTIKSRNYSATVDYYSQFFEVDFLEHMRSESVIHKLKAHFARHGIPDMLIILVRMDASSCRKNFKSFVQVGTLIM